MDLDNLSLKELKKLRNDVDKAIKSFETRKKKEALAALEAKAAEMGFSLGELTGGAVKKSAPPKYQNPDNVGQKWTGRGRQPAWFKAAIEAGKSPDDLLI